MAISDSCLHWFKANSTWEASFVNDGASYSTDFSPGDLGPDDLPGAEPRAPDHPPPLARRVGRVEREGVERQRDAL